MTTASNNAIDDPAAKPRSKRRSRTVLILLFAMFLAPILVALLMQSTWFHVTFQPTRNFGELLQPVVPVPLGNAQQPGKATQAEAVWTLLYLPPETGTNTDIVRLLQQVRLTQGRNQDRVKLELISGAVSTVDAIWRTQALSSAELIELRRKLGVGAEGAVLILDPFRNAMMRHPGLIDGTKLRKDLARLLRASQAGKARSEGVIV
jgi:hypothetical protein